MSSSPPNLASLRIDREAPPPRPPGAMRLMRWAIPVLAIAAVVAWLFLAPRAPQVRGALAGAPGGGTLSSAGISANGYVVARTKASVSEKTAGRVEYVGLAEGTRVKL